MPKRCLGLLLSIVIASIVLAAVPLAAEAAPNCAAEASTLKHATDDVRIDLDVPPNLTAGGAVKVAWHATKRAPLKSPVFIVVAFDGDARVEAPPLPASDAAPDDLSNASRAPDLPGFLVLSSASPGPLGLAFGKGKSRVLVPLHLPGAKLQGEFQIHLYDAVDTKIDVAVVAHTACGERLLLPLSSRSLTVKPGRPEIVVQDPFDLERPDRVLVSNSGRYRANIFNGRYRIFDTATGAKLVDRAGHDPNFSPTSRFVVANTGARGSDDYEVIDLISRNVVATPHGEFIGWVHGDSFLVVGDGSWGNLSVRPTLISRVVLKSNKEEPDPSVPEEAPDDGLALRHPGSCHACTSWRDDSMMLDLDNGILVFSGGFELEGRPVFELATGASLCCKQAAQTEQAFINRNYAVVPFHMSTGWHAREPIRFSQIYDPLADPSSAQNSDKDSLKSALVLRGLLQTHRALDPKAKTVEIAEASGTTVVRGDWREGVAATVNSGSADNVRTRLFKELARFNVNAAATAPREAIPFNNSWTGPDRAKQYQGDEALDKRIDDLIDDRTNKIEERIKAEVPATAAHLLKTPPPGDSTYVSPLPLQGLDKSGIYLGTTLEGLWRWQIRGRPTWFLQLWATEGNGGIGEGALFLFEGTDPSHEGGGGRIVDLTQSLSSFWAGAYGIDDEQTRLKPEVYLDRYLVAGSIAGKSIVVYDLVADKALAILKDVPQADLMSEVVLTDDAAHVIQLNSDGQFFIHELAGGRLSLSGRVVDDEIVIYTPEGYYWASYEGAHFVQLRFPGLPGLYPFQQFASVLDRPEIISAQMRPSTGAPPPPQLVPPPIVDIDRRGIVIDPDRIKLDVNIRSGEPLTHLRFYADGLRIDDESLEGLTASRQISLPRPENARWLSAQAADVNGLVSKPEAIRLPAKAEKTNVLRAVVVGINTYGTPKMRLNFARSDAERLGAALGANAGHYYARSEVTSLIDGAATKDAVLSALKRAVSEASATDTLVFSFAGHGVQGPDRRYYLTPVDFDLHRIADTGLAWSDVASVLQGSKARVIVILDSCHAGLTGAQELGTNDDAVAALLSGAHAPMLVLAATKGRQLSFEGGRWGGGVFTSALIKAIQSDRSSYDLDHNGAIEASELYYALKSVVVGETGGKQTPWLVRQDLLGDFALF